MVESTSCLHLVPFQETETERTMSKENGGLLKLCGSAVAVGLLSAYVWWQQGAKAKDDKDDKRASFAASKAPSTSFEADSILMDLFQGSARIANSLKHISNGDKLMLYGLYKQATVGDCPEQAPSPFNIVAHAKHASWCKFQGMRQKDAMIYYMQAVQQLKNGENISADDDEGDDGGMGGMGGMGLKPSMPAEEEEDDEPEENEAPEITLRRAASSDNINSMRQCMGRGAKVNSTDENGQTALHFCADRGFEKGVELLLQKKADPNAADLDGISVLQAAVISDHVAVCKLLLQKGANPDLEDTDGDSPRSCALEDGSAEMKALFADFPKNTLNGEQTQ